MLARARTYTPVLYWMDLPLAELVDWTETVNKVEERESQQRKNSK